MINSDAIADENRKFRLIVVDPLKDGEAEYKGKKVKKVSEFSVHIYYGAFLYYEGATDEELPIVTVPENKFPLIVDKGSEAIFDEIETDIPEVIKIIRNAGVNIREKASFPMIEPNRVVL